MKTLPLISLLAAAVAFALSFVNFEAALSLLLSAGVIRIMVADYSRRPRVLAAWQTPVHRFSAQRRPAAPAFGLAA